MDDWTESTPGIPVMDLAELVACHDCDLLQRRRPLRHGERARCTRCGAGLYKEQHDSLDKTLALTLAGVILFVVANVFPFMSFSLEGRVQECRILSGVMALVADGKWVIAAVVGLASFIAPLLNLLLLLYVLLPLKFDTAPWKLPASYRVIEILGPWSMLEVYLLGAIVAVVKLSGMADIGLGFGFHAFAGLIIVTTAAGAVFDPRLVWNRLARVT